MIRLYSTFHALIWYVDFRSEGGSQISIASLMIHPTAGIRAEGLNRSDERMGEAAAIARVIELCLEEAVRNGIFNKRDINVVMKGACIQLKEDRRLQSYSARLKEARASRRSGRSVQHVPRPRTLNKRETGLRDRAYVLSRRLWDLFVYREVIQS